MPLHSVLWSLSVDITYKSKKLEKECTNRAICRKKHGDKMAKVIFMRIDQISAATFVEELVVNKIGRCHALIGERDRQYAIDLMQPYRLIFEKHGDTIQIANILEIVDYH